MRACTTRPFFLTWVSRSPPPFYTAKCQLQISTLRFHFPPCRISSSHSFRTVENEPKAGGETKKWKTIDPLSDQPSQGRALEGVGARGGGGWRSRGSTGKNEEVCGQALTHTPQTVVQCCFWQHRSIRHSFPIAASPRIARPGKECSPQDFCFFWTLLEISNCKCLSLTENFSSSADRFTLFWDAFFTILIIKKACLGC